MSYKIQVLFSKDKNGYYVYCPELPGCHSQGDTFEEANENIKEAISLYLETMDKEELKEMTNKELLSTTIEVEFA